MLGNKSPISPLHREDLFLKAQHQAELVMDISSIIYSFKFLNYEILFKINGRLFIRF